MYLTRFFIAFMLLLIPAVIDADIQGELATPGSKDFLSIQPCSPHLGEYPTARIVAYQFGYNPEVLENLTFDLSPSPTVEEYCSAIGSNSGGGYQCTHGDETGIMVQCYEWSTQGRNARNTAYTALCQDYPSWEPYLWENEMTGVFYSIDVDYPLIAQLARFNNGVFQSEICDAEVFTAYGGCHTVASTVGLSANHQERWDNAVGFWLGQGGVNGPDDRAACNAILHCPNLHFSQGDGLITLAPIVKATSHEEFMAVPRSFTFEVEFNAAMDMSQDVTDFCDFTDGCLYVDDGSWVDQYTARLDVRSLGEGNACGTFEVDGAIRALGNEAAILDGDRMFPNGDNFVFYVGEDCGAGNTNLRGYDAASNSFRWCVDGEDGHTLAWAVEGWNGESWFEDVRVPPGNGDMQVTLSQPWDEVRLLCYNTDSPRPTYHGSLARGHVGKAYRPFSGDRDSLMARAWFRLENPASAGPRGQHNFRDRQTTALFTKSSFIDEHAPLVQYLTNWGNTDVIIIDVERWQRGEARRQGIKATIDSLWRARGINSVVFDAGLTNDWEVWTQPWPAQTGWDVIQENYWETHPPEGNPEWDDIPMAAYILDDAEREFNTAFWTPYVPSMDLYGDVDGDSIPDLDIGFIPVKSEADLAGIIYKNMTYMDMDGLWDSHFESAVFVGDEDYDNPGDGANALRNAELLASLFPSSSYQRWLKQSDGNSYWRTDQFINIHQDGQTFSLFTGPNASRNNLASITWSDIFQWSDVGDCWPGVTLGVTCGLGNVGMTRRYDQPYVLFEDALAQPWGGQIMGVVSFCGTLDDDLVYFFECLLSRLMAEREVALGTHVRMAKRDCAAMGRYSKTVKSIVLMGFPWIRMNNVAHACAVDEPDELTLDFSPPSRIARTLSFTTTSPGLVGVRLVDIAGRTLYHNTASMLPGQHEVNLPHLASGAYFFSLESGGRRWTQRAILMR